MSPASLQDCSLAEMDVPWALRGACIHNVCASWRHVFEMYLYIMLYHFFDLLSTECETVMAFLVWILLICPVWRGAWLVLVFGPKFLEI